MYVFKIRITKKDEIKIKNFNKERNIFFYLVGLSSSATSSSSNMDALPWGIPSFRLQKGTN
jgi:hypothetical protein